MGHHTRICLGKALLNGLSKFVRHKRFGIASLMGHSGRGMLTMLIRVPSAPLTGRNDPACLSDNK